MPVMPHPFIFRPALGTSVAHPPQVVYTVPRFALDRGEKFKVLSVAP